MEKALKGIPCDGDKISSARRNKPASQNEVAVAVGVQRETVSMWEQPGIKGIRAGHFRRLLEFLGVNGEEIRANETTAPKRYVRRDQSGAFVSKTSPPDKRILHDTESAKFAGGRDDYSHTLPAGNDPKPQRDRPAERQPHAGTGIPTIDAVSLDSDASAALRDAAAKYGTTPSDLVRHLLGLPPRTKPPKRPKTKARAR